METAVHIYPSRHRAIAWGELKAAVYRWSASDVVPVWAATIELSARHPGDCEPGLADDAVLDTRRSYRIDLAGDDYGPWITYHSLEGRSDPASMLQSLGNGTTLALVEPIASDLRAVGYYLIVSTRPREQPFVARLRATACALADLLQANVGVYRDDFVGLEDHIYRLDEFAALELPYRVRRVGADD